MKVLIGLLVLSLSLLHIVSSTTWVNFIPYASNPNCLSEVNGVGYSFAVGECFTLDYVKYWYFEAFDELTVQWDSYLPSIDGQPNCVTPEHEVPYYIKDGQCIEYIESKFDLNFVSLANTSYQILVGDSPIYPKFSYVNTYNYGTSCSHTSTTALFSTFATNGTMLYPDSNPIYNPTNDIVRSVFCSDNNPLMYHCSDQTQNITCDYINTEVNCKHIKPFVSISSSQSQDSDYKYYTSTSCFGSL